MGAILVTGGAGYIGSHTSKLLLQKGYDVVILDTLELGHRQVLDFLPGAKLVQGDIGDGTLVASTIKDNDIDSVIHFAAYASVPDSVADPVKYYQNNITKTLTLLDALNAQGVKHVLFSSSAATFGETKYVPIDEKHPQFPTNPYGQTKLDAEHILHWYDVAFGIKSISLRYFCAAGADRRGTRRGPHARDAHDPPDPLRRPGPPPGHQDVRHRLPHPRRDRRPRLHPRHRSGPGAHPRTRSPEERRPTNAYNLGNGKGYSVREVIETGRAVTGKPIVATEAPRRPVTPPNSSPPAPLGADATAVADQQHADGQLGVDRGSADGTVVGREVTTDVGQLDEAVD